MPTTDPRTLARHATMRRIRKADLAASELAARRRRLQGSGVSGPLTRADLARMAAR